MSDPMAEIRASFFIECEELLEGLQDGLQLMEDGDTDGETVNVVFRAVHSIKGGAASLTAHELAQIAFELEKMGLSGNLDQETCLATKLQKELHRLKLFFDKQKTSAV